MSIQVLQIRTLSPVRLTSWCKKRLASVMSLKTFLFCLAVKFVIVFGYYSLSSKAISFTYDLGKPKTILIWNSAHRIETSAFGVGHEAFVNASCPVSYCTIYTNRSELPLDEYDAIIVQMHELWLTERPSFERRAGQRFIFLSQESPGLLPIDPSDFGGFFNWTMTYRHNSDIPLLYGRIKEKTTAPKTPTELEEFKSRMHDLSKTNYAAGKSDLVAWMVSHCDTPGKREDYVRELAKSVKVDTYGGCGDLQCDRDNENWLSYPFCYDMLESKYKFYLSFENAICRDYVTEKFFNILQYKMVPIVYGGANYSEIAPPHSYINALDFTPEGLAEYLKMLDANETLYNEYFWWKEHYEVESGVHQMARHAFCDLCLKLHQDEQVKYYEDLVPEWHSSNACLNVKSWNSSA